MKHSKNQLIHYADFPSAHVPARNVDIWLPPDYDEERGERYGVLYMNDGQNIFDNSRAFGGESWEVVPALKRLMAAGQAPPVIIVGVWNTPQRGCEYLPERPFANPNRQRFLDEQAAWLGGPPQSDAYLRFLVTELKPFVDDHYRTRPGPAHTTIMGSSMGGLISLYALCEYPQVFGRAGCLSTHWPAVEAVILDYLEEGLPPPGNHRLYFDYGTETLDALYEPMQQQVDALMLNAGYTPGRDWLSRRFEGAAHNEQAWRERVHIPLRFLLQP